MASVTIGQAEKYFGRTHIIKGVSIDIADGEFCVLVGPSGCGKSTLLRMIAGLEEISAGDIYIGDKRVNQMPPKERDIAMVFQNYALYPHMTVRDNSPPPKSQNVSISLLAYWACTLCLTAIPDNSLADNASVSPWAGLLCATRKCFCSMNRCPIWMPNCVCQCALKSKNCTNV
jgi:ABC-type Fe3+/spermidine/putrescine transport system ATPase subunit